MSKHTPTPWHVVPETLGSIRSANGIDVGQTFATVNPKSAADHEERLANAAYIVRAVNAHEQLVEALRVIAGGSYDDAMLVAERALRAAGVEP